MSVLSRIPKFRRRASQPSTPQALIPGRIPHPYQLRYLGAYLNRIERWFLRIASLLIVSGIIVGVWQFWTVHLELIPQDGGTYIEGLVGEPSTINPLYLSNNDVDQDLSHLVYSALFRTDQTEQLIPDIATGYDLSEDQKVYTIHLRDGVLFHDLQSLDANDVVFTVTAMQDPNYASPYRATFKGIQVEAVDERTVTFTLPEPFSPFPSSLTFGILPEHLWSTILPEQASRAALNLTPIGSGPYQYDRIKKDRSGGIKSMTFVRNESFYASLPHIERLEFKFYPDLEGSILAFKDGNVDGLSFLPSTRKAEVENAVGNVHFQSLRLPQYTAVFFNLNTEILKDRVVREALSKTADKQAIITTALHGEGNPIHTPILPGQLGHNPDITAPVVNVDEANKLLDDAGWKIVDDAASENNGWRMKDGKVLRFTIRTINQPEFVAVATELQNAWKALHADIHLDAFPSRDVQSAVINDREYEALLFGVILGADTDPYPFWHSSQTKHPGLNLSILKNKKVDALLEEARSSTDQEQRRAKYVEFQQIIAEEIPAIFLYNPVYTYAHDEKLKGIETTFITRPSDRFRDIASWYINTKRQFPNEE